MQSHVVQDGGGPEPATQQAPGLAMGPSAQRMNKAVAHHYTPHQRSAQLGQVPHIIIIINSITTATTTGGHTTTVATHTLYTSHGRGPTRTRTPNAYGPAHLAVHLCRGAVARPSGRRQAGGPRHIQTTKQSTA